MTLGDFYRRLHLDDSLVRETGFNPYYCGLQSGLDDPIIVDGLEFIDLASNNYLGLASDGRIKSAIMEATGTYGASLCGTPIATGYCDLFRSVEARAAAFVGLEDGILLPSCYQANNGLFAAIAGPEDVILIDRFAHSSLVQGAKAVGCKVRPFRHNDPEHVQDILGRLKGFRQAFVVTESVFSTEGSIAPFREIVDLCGRFEAVPVIDDSHGIGVLGQGGHGVLEHLGIATFQGIYTASFGKALANGGGLIAGQKILIDHLRYYCPQLVYSTALSPGVLAGIRKVLDLLETGFDAIGSRLWRNRDIVRQGLVTAGFPVIPGEAPINSIAAGDAVQTISLTKAFHDSRILTTPFVFPSVPRDQGRVRLIAGAHLTEERLSAVTAAMARIALQFPGLCERP